MLSVQKKVKTNRGVSRIRINNEVVTDSHRIAEIFNDHFVPIGKKLRSVFDDKMEVTHTESSSVVACNQFFTLKTVHFKYKMLLRVKKTPVTRETVSHQFP